MRKFLFLLITCALPLTVSAVNADSVLALAVRANAYFMTVHPDPTTPTNVGRLRPSNLWTRGVYYEGLMQLYAVNPQPSYLQYALRWAIFHKWSPRNGLKTTNADDQCCGQTYLELMDRAHLGDSCLLPIKSNIDNQMVTGRSDYWSWIDAVQMAMPLCAQLYKKTGDRHYLDYAMECYHWTKNVCGGGTYNRKDGLWWRDADFVPPYREPDGKPCYWSRGNGWIYAALVRVMQTIGKEDAYYKELKHDFLSMSKALVECQRTDGLWNPSLLSTNYAGKEVTGSALFLYGLSWGLRNGVLKKAVYRKACDKAWDGLSACVHSDGFIGYVQGTGKQPSDSQPLSYDRKPDFDDFGVGCFLLGSCQYYLLLKD